MSKMFQDSIHETDEVNEEDRNSYLLPAQKDNSPAIVTEDIDESSLGGSYKIAPSFGGLE